MERIVFLDRSAIRVELRKPKFPHEWVEYSTISKDNIVKRLQEATIAVTNRVSLGEQELTSLTKLKHIAIAATGVDCVDLGVCRDRGIAVSNVRNWSVSVPEHVFALMLALRQNLFAYRDAIQKGAWEKSESFSLLLEPMQLTLWGTTMGIVGYGILGRRVAKIAEAYGMNVVVSERKGAGIIREGRTEFNKTLESSDVLVILCPLTEETRGLVGMEELKKMPRHALLINCARGRIVCEADLANALTEGIIAGAGVDVLNFEPPRGDNALLKLHQDNFVITPHVAWASKQSLQILGDQLIDNLEAFAEGNPKNIVT